MPIINNKNANYTYLTEDNVWGVDCKEEICITDDQHPINYRFTSGELWHKPIIKSIGEKMKMAFLDKYKRDKKIESNKKLRKHFENVSYMHLIKEKLVC